MNITFDDVSFKYIETLFFINYLSYFPIITYSENLK